MLLADKVAIVTGAGSGIGAASAIRFAEEGAAVLVADIREHKADQTVSEIEARGGVAQSCQVDVADADSVAAMVDDCVQHFARVDVLFNNAGTLRIGTVVSLPVEDWDLVMGVNVRSVFLGAKFAIPHMRAQGSGSIINTASVSGLHGDGNGVVYAASKAAVINLTRAMSTDHAAEGIRVNAICPGTIETPPVARMAQEPEFMERNIAAHAIGRLGHPEEIASVAVWLASDEASFVTGEAIVADGGLRARSPLGRLADPRPRA
jgi:NAD(P)-dependent dehydrogenase (short-subunit alcohol dehydrogenase family)